MTQNNWFRLREIGDGSYENAYRPNLHGHSLDWTGNKSQTGENPFWIVRVYGAAEELDRLESDLSRGEQRLDNLPDEALNNMFGQDRDVAGWERGFKIGE